MNVLHRWFGCRACSTVADSLARIEGTVRHMDNTLDDIKNNQAKLRALIEKLLGLLTSVPAGTFTAEQQAEINAIVADQQTTLAEDTTETKA